jgi:hypothetical protein
MCTDNIKPHAAGNCKEKPAEMDEKRIFIRHILPMLETASLSKVECVYWLLLKW